MREDIQHVLGALVDSLEPVVARGLLEFIGLQSEVRSVPWARHVGEYHSYEEFREAAVNLLYETGSFGPHSPWMVQSVSLDANYFEDPATGVTTWSLWCYPRRSTPNDRPQTRPCPH